MIVWRPESHHRQSEKDRLVVVTLFGLRQSRYWKMEIYHLPLELLYLVLEYALYKEIGAQGLQGPRGTCDKRNWGPGIWGSWMSPAKKVPRVPTKNLRKYNDLQVKNKRRR